MGARPGLDFIRRKWLHVIINDDFLEEGECYDRALLPSIICLGRLRIASKYIFNLWQLRQGVDSLAQWLEHWIFNREDRVRFPGKTEYFFSYASFLCYGYHVVRRDIGKQCRPRSDAAECGIWAGSTLFASNTGISIKHGNTRNLPDTPSTGNGPVQILEVEESG